METQALKLAVQDEMIAEARDIIDQARARGVVLRLYGGLAVRAYCDVIGFCARDYSDFDMIGLKTQRRQLRDPGFAVVNLVRISVCDAHGEGKRTFRV